MNAHLENKVSMYHKVRTFFANHESQLTTPIPILSNKVLLFNEKLDELLQFEQEATEVTTGYAVEKQNVRNQLIEAALIVAGGASAYAIDIGNSTMTKKVHFTKSMLNEMRDTDFIVKLQDLYSTCNPSIVSLTPYGVPTQKITNFHSLLNQYHQLYQNPGDQRAEGASYHIEVENTVEKIDSILQIIDGLIETVSITHTILYNQYKFDRMIDDYGTGSNTPPDIETSIAPLSFQSVLNIPYLGIRHFKVKNLSNDPLKWSLSTSDTVFSTPPQELLPNSTSNKLSSTLAPAGDFLLFQNETANHVNIEVTIDE